MNRKKFLQQIGLGAAFMLTAGCFQSCKKNDDSNDDTTTESGSVDFTLNLNDSKYATLLTKGNYLVINNVVVAYTTTGLYVAATRTCSHEGKKAVYYRSSDNIFFCPEHAPGAQFDLNGKGKNSLGISGLTIYKTALDDQKNLRVYA